MLPPWPIGTNHSASGPATDRSPTSREDGNEPSLRLRRGSRVCCCRRGADGRRENRRRASNNADGLVDDRRARPRLGGRRRGCEPLVREFARRRQRQGRDPDLGRAPDEARCSPRRRPCPRRRRAREHRNDHYGAVGMRKAPASLDAFIAAGKKVMARHKSDRNYSALYFPGKYWYAGMSFVYDYGGAIARFKNGRWVGTLNSPQALAGLTKLKSTVLALSRANRSGTEAEQWTVFSQGHVGADIANGWEWGLISDPKIGDPALAPVLGAFPMPSHNKGKFMPTFLGGSDLAIPASSSNRALAIDWIRAFTSTSSMRQLTSSAGVIPNTTSLVNINASKPTLAPFARAATSSWFVPTAPNWVNVENAQVLQNMLAEIFTGRRTVRAAATRASAQITQILNAR